MTADAQSQKTRMLSGQLYDPRDRELADERRRAARLTWRFNMAAPDDPEASAGLHALLGGLGASSTIRAPFYCDYGYNIQIGSGCFLNFGCVLLDVAAIHIGDHCQIGPSVQLLCADHPRAAALRREGLERGEPIRIHDNVWIGAGAIILPGVSVGPDAIVAAGAVVTRDVPPGATVMGTPARPAGSEPPDPGP